MRTGSTSPVATPAASRPVHIEERPAIAARLLDYVELTRPKIALMAMLTVAIGYSLAARDVWKLEPLLHAAFGIALVAAASSALNQLLERETDSLMARTADRPLPAGRISPWEVLCFGLITGIGGCLYLLITVNPLTALLAFITLLIYVGGYTPMKSRSRLCTTVGAVAGALPPVLGWTAAGGELTFGAVWLFAILFLWQFPHFLAIAWLYRDDYEDAGLKMLPSEGRRFPTTGVVAALYALALLPVSLLPSESLAADALAGGRYTAAAILLGLAYLVFSIRFARRESEKTARQLLWISLLYLPLLLTVLTWDHFSLLN